MRQLLILMICGGVALAQDVGKTIGNLVEKFPGMFEISEEMKEKIEVARAKHIEIMEEIKVMSKEEKITYFNKMREEAKIKLEAKMEKLSPELKARIEAKMVEIKARFEKKKSKMDEIKAKNNAYNKAKTEVGIEEIYEIIKEIKPKYGKVKEKWIKD